MSSMTFSGAQNVIDDVIDGSNDVINYIFRGRKMSSMTSLAARTMSSMTFSGAENVINDVIGGRNDVINDILEGGAPKCHRKCHR